MHVIRLTNYGAPTFEAADFGERVF